MSDDESDIDSDESVLSFDSHGRPKERVITAEELDEAHNQANMQYFRSGFNTRPEYASYLQGKADPDKCDWEAHNRERPRPEVKLLKKYAKFLKKAGLPSRHLKHIRQFKPEL